MTSEKITITLPAVDENLQRVLDFVENSLEEHDAGMKAIMPITVSVEEIFVNIAHYAYETHGDAEIIIDYHDDEVTITMVDSGMEFDPLAKEDPDITLKAEDRDIGGLGIFMVKKSMDHCEYHRIDGKNIFSMSKKIR